MPYYIPCEPPGCRHVDDLQVCDTCEALVCALHSVASGEGNRRCRACAGVPLRKAPSLPPLHPSRGCCTESRGVRGAQLDLFTQ